MAYPVEKINISFLKLGKKKKKKKKDRKGEEPGKERSENYFFLKPQNEKKNIFVAPNVL